MGRLPSEVLDHALGRPWLLVPPLMGLLGQNTLSLLFPGDPVAVALKVVLTALMTAGVTTLFAWLWLSDGRGLNTARLVETGILFILPYPLLLVFGAVSTPFVYWILRADVPQVASMGALYLVLAAGKLAAFGLGALSAVSAARRRESSGSIGALRLGGRVLCNNAGFFFLMLAGFWVFQEACVYLARSLAPGMLDGLLTMTIPLLGAVAFPITAWRSGRLKE